MTRAGHGALTIALKNPGEYRSVSAFAPICNPVLCPWGQKAFTGYLVRASHPPAACAHARPATPPGSPPGPDRRRASTSR